MSFHSFDPTQSWGSIACFVVVIHICLITLSLFVESSPPPAPKAQGRLVVQTVDLSPKSEQLLAFAPAPLPPNPIKRSPLPPHPLENTPLPPTPLERKTMKQEPATPPRIPEVPPRPAPTPEPEAKESAADHLSPPTIPAPKAPPVKKPEPVKKSLTTPKAEQPIKKIENKTKKPPIPAKKATSPTKTAAPKAAKPPAKAADDLKKKQEEEAQKLKAEAETQKKKAEIERQQKLLADAQERISKIAGNRSPPNAKTSSPTLPALPNTISNLHIEALPAAKEAPSLTPREITYRDELAGRLKLLLKLPEYGDVRVSLTLNRDGRVDKVAILSTESTANKKYIEKILPTLSFSPFGANFESLSQYTFIIKLTNE